MSGWRDKLNEAIGPYVEGDDQVTRVQAMALALVLAERIVALEAELATLRSTARR